MWLFAACQPVDPAVRDTEVADTQPDDTDDTDVVDTDPPVEDGVVLPPGEDVEVEVTFTLPAPRTMDVALVLDASCAGSEDTWGFYDVVGRRDALGIADAAWGVASWSDYGESPFGAAGADLPFVLDWPITEDLDRVEAALGRLSSRAGLDRPDAGFEALYQTLTGAGYDLGCDGIFDSDVDVPVFAPAAGDPFGGRGPAAWPSGTAGSGGGLGFREGAVPVVVLVADGHVRDLALDGGPGGCAEDASLADAVGAAAARGAWIVGAHTRYDGAESDLEAQLAGLALASRSSLDLDGDGEVEPLVVDMADGDVARWQADLDAALRAIATFEGLYPRYAALVAEADDPQGFVRGVAPPRVEDVDPRLTPQVTLRVQLHGAVPSSEDAQRFVIDVRLRDGDVVVASSSIVVWVP